MHIIRWTFVAKSRIINKYLHAKTEAMARAAPITLQIVAVFQSRKESSYEKLYQGTSYQNDKQKSPLQNVRCPFIHLGLVLSKFRNNYPPYMFACALARDMLIECY